MEPYNVKIPKYFKLDSPRGWREFCIKRTGDSLRALFVVLRRSLQQLEILGFVEDFSFN